MDSLTTFLFCNCQLPISQPDSVNNSFTVDEVSSGIKRRCLFNTHGKEFLRNVKYTKISVQIACSKKYFERIDEIVKIYDKIYFLRCNFNNRCLKIKFERVKWRFLPLLRDNTINFKRFENIVYSKIRL